MRMVASVRFIIFETFETGTFSREYFFSARRSASLHRLYERVLRFLADAFLAI
jgi:hypothetical protein